jgi:sugar-specific transcriptional regulator TrmB
MEQKLKELGLTQYETEAYIGLLKNGSLTANELVKKTNIPHGKVYFALHDLVKKNFINITNIKPQIFSPIKPELAINKFIEEKTQNLSTLKQDILSHIKNIKKPSETASEKVQVLSGIKTRKAIVEHFITNVKKELRIMVTYESYPAELMRELYKVAKKGIKVNILATKKTKQGLKWMKQDMKNGLNIRYYSVEEIRLHIMDSSEASLSVINPKDRRDRVYIYFQTSAKYWKDYFDNLWKKAKKIS